MAERGRNYIDGKRLNELAIHARDTGETSDELVELLYQMARIIFDSLKATAVERADAVQEAVLQCWQEIPGLNDEGTAYAYFRLIIFNRYRRLLRDAARQQRKPDLPILSCDDPASLSDDSEPSKCRRIMHLRLESDIEAAADEGVPTAEIAKRYRVSRDDVTRAAKRGRKRRA